MQQPSADLLPLVIPVIEKFMSQVYPGDVIAIKWSIQRY
jgi:3-hydroxymyristoyl/3-hydroxydecanoyl-(acyl carrier protein) dehydratase